MVGKLATFIKIKTLELNICSAQIYAQYNMYEHTMRIMWGQQLL